MTQRRFHRLPICALALLLAVALSACSDVPGLGGNGEASPVASSAASPTRAPAMRIVTPTPVPSGSPAGGIAPTPPATNPETYVVQEGDTLYAIALRFDTTLEALIELNGLSDPNDIQVGQELRIPPRQQD